MFNVVECLATNTVAIVSHAWMQGDTFCRWPAIKNAKKVETLKCLDHAIPGTDWQMLAVRVMSSPRKFSNYKCNYVDAIYDSLYTSNINVKKQTPCSAITSNN